jgi:NAD(P)H-dependent FMN reductase
MKILAISGSMNANSSTKKATEITIQAAKKAGGTVELIHLADLPLPIFDCRKDKTTYPENVHQFINKVEEADGLILSSPEYHGSLTGALKNALDFVGGRQMEGKVVALLATAGSALGATNTLNTLQLICRNLHAWPLPLSPSVPRAYDAFNEDGTLKDKKLQERLEELGYQLVKELKLREQHINNE